MIGMSWWSLKVELIFEWRIYKTRLWRESQLWWDKLNSQYSSGPKPFTAVWYLLQYLYALLQTYLYVSFGRFAKQFGVI